MKISFVIPAYNEEKYLPLCLKALQKEIAKGSYDTEVVVVNNASTDSTEAVARSFPGVIVVNESRKGLTFARQAGFLASSGDLIANVDADTVLPSQWLSTVMREFTNDPKLLAFSGPHVYYDLPAYKRYLTHLWYLIGYSFVRLSNFLFHTGSILQGGNYVVRREALAKIGGFDTSIEFWGEDTDIAKRLHKIGKVKWTFKLPMYASGRRIEANGIFKTGFLYAITFFWIIFTKKPFTQKYNDVRFKKE